VRERALAHVSALSPHPAVEERVGGGVGGGVAGGEG